MPRINLLPSAVDVDNDDEFPYMRNDVASKTTPQQIVDAIARKQNLAAAVAPTVNDDSSAGYSVGSWWIDTTADRAYVCVDASVGAAVWISVADGAPKGNYLAVGAPAVGNDNTEGYARGSLWIDNFNKQTYVATDVGTGAAVWLKWSKPSALPPVDVAAAGAVGTSLDFSREDHAHAHGDQAGGTQHAAAASGLLGETAAAGFLSALDKDSIFGRRRVFSLEEDWANGSLLPNGWTNLQNGAGANVAVVASDADHPGIVAFGTGTTNTGRSGVAMSLTGSIVISGGRWHLSAVLRLPTLADATEDYDVLFGAVNSATTNAPGRGVWFAYRRALDGANWRAKAGDGLGVQDADTTIAVVAGDWYRLDIVIENGVATYFINGVQRAQISTAIPTTTAHGFALMILKSAGTTARLLDSDYVGLRKELTNER